MKTGRTEPGRRRPYRISLIGAGRASAREEEVARRVGREVAERGAILVCGGLGGVMAAAAEGCREGGGTTVGILPGTEPEEADAGIEIPVATGLGEARNLLVVRAGEAVITVGGSWGTLSEIALARKVGRPVVTLLEPPAAELGLPEADTPEAAVAWALARAEEGRRRSRGRR